MTLSPWLLHMMAPTLFAVFLCSLVRTGHFTKVSDIEAGKVAEADETHRQDNCKSWCHSHPQPWSRKCKWGSGHCSACDACGNLTLNVHSTVPGLAASTKYACEVKEDGQSWRTAFVFESMPHVSHKSVNHNVANGYFAGLDGWSASWVSFEIAEGTPVEVKITRLDTIAPFQEATVHPVHTALAKAEIGDISPDAVTVKVSGPSQFTVDINGAMDDSNTAQWALSSGAQPVHTFTIFANPMLDWDDERPNPNHDNVRTVAPGEFPPVDFPEDVLYFLPGVHNITVMPKCCITPVTADNEVPEGCDATSQDGYAGIACTKTLVPAFEIKGNKHYYVPGDAWLDGWMANTNWGIENTKLFGYGVVSGRKYQRRYIIDNDKVAPKALFLRGAANVTIAGVTFVDNINHHIGLAGKNSAPDRPNTMHHVKVIGWRANGDGTHVFGYWNVHDMFLRTQDDSTYVVSGSRPPNGVIAQTFRRIVTWNDANGVPFILSANGQGWNTILEDSEVIYHRKSWPWWCGGVFDLRDAGGPVNKIHHFIARNILITDPFPTCPLFDLTGGMSDIRFENVKMNSFSSYQKYHTSWHCKTEKYRWLDGTDCNLPYGIPNQIIGAKRYEVGKSSVEYQQGYEMKDVTFENVSYGGQSASQLVGIPSAFKLVNCSGFIVDGQRIN